MIDSKEEVRVVTIDIKRKLKIDTFDNLPVQSIFSFFDARSKFLKISEVHYNDFRK